MGLARAWNEMGRMRPSPGAAEKSVCSLAPLLQQPSRPKEEQRWEKGQVILEKTGLLKLAGPWHARKTKDCQIQGWRPEHSLSEGLEMQG